MTNANSERRGPLDYERIIHWSHVSPVGVNPGADGILRALDDLAERRAAL